MALNMHAKLIVMVVVALAVVSMPIRTEAAIGCGTVVSYLNSCLPYVTRNGPLGACCGGIRGLYNLAKTTPDRQSVCSCLKTLAGSYSVDLNKAAGLPSQCGVNIPYKISPSTDCAKVK